jgi:gas vesicle protein
MQSKSLIGGLMVGAALGAAAGLLLAPRSGEQTRRKLVNGTMKLKKNVVNYIDESIDNLREQLNVKIDQIVKRGKDTINTVGEKVKV